MRAQKRQFWPEVSTVPLYDMHVIFFFFSIRFIVLQEYHPMLHINNSQRQSKGGMTGM
jgi:hypothetical protein